MKKTFHYLAGLPRSGNTVLSSILNQHPDIHSGALSPVCEYLWVLHLSSLTHENVIRNKDKSGTNSILSNLLDSHYVNINNPIIFDREKSWGTPGNLSLIKKYITKEPKIVYTVRPIVEVLTSFLSLDTSWIDRRMIETSWDSKNYLSLDDNRCDFLMRPYGEIDRGMLFVNELMKEENKDVFHVVEYSDLVSYPQKTMDNIYQFIGIKPFNHDFNSIIKVDEDDDAALGMPKDLHDVRLTLSKVSKKPEDVLSDYVLTKYSNIEFWNKTQKISKGT
jgi:sulfotransferase